MTDANPNYPRLASREEWKAARKALLEKEKTFTRERDALNAERRRLPMVKIEKDYVFEGPDGKTSLLDLFEGRRQLIVRHFMFHPDWDKGCPACTAGADEICDGLIKHLNARDTSLAVIARAPSNKLNRFRAHKGWTFPLYSSYGSDFNYDFHVTLDESVTPIEYNYRSKADYAGMKTAFQVEGEQPLERPGQSCFLRDGDAIFHTYSNYARGFEMVGGAYYYLDLTALGRQEEWEEPKERAGNTHQASPDFS